MQTFNSAREAKEYLIAQILLEAEGEGIPLSETERKMMYFTETGWALPDIWEVNEVFERDYDRPAYEGKIGNLARRARAHAAATNEAGTWKEAIRALKLEDHYLLVLLLNAPTESSDSLWVDRLKLVGAALLACLLLIAGIFLFSSKK